MQCLLTAFQLEMAVSVLLVRCVPGSLSTLYVSSPSSRTERAVVINLVNSPLEFLCVVLQQSQSVLYFVVWALLGPNMTCDGFRQRERCLRIGLQLLLILVIVYSGDNYIN